MIPFSSLLFGLRGFQADDNPLARRLNPWRSKSLKNHVLFAMLLFVIVLPVVPLLAGVTLASLRFSLTLSLYQPYVFVPLSFFVLGWRPRHPLEIIDLALVPNRRDEWFAAAVQWPLRMIIMNTVVGLATALKIAYSYASAVFPAPVYVEATERFLLTSLILTFVMVQLSARMYLQTFSFTGFLASFSCYPLVGFCYDRLNSLLSLPAVLSLPPGILASPRYLTTYNVYYIMLFSLVLILPMWVHLRHILRTAPYMMLHPVVEDDGPQAVAYLRNRLFWKKEGLADHLRRRVIAEVSSLFPVTLIFGIILFFLLLAPFLFQLSRVPSHVFPVRPFELHLLPTCLILVILAYKHRPFFTDFPVVSGAITARLLPFYLVTVLVATLAWPLIATRIGFGGRFTFRQLGFCAIAMAAPILPALIYVTFPRIRPILLLLVFALPFVCTWIRSLGLGFRDAFSSLGADINTLICLLGILLVPVLIQRLHDKHVLWKPLGSVSNETPDDPNVQFTE